MPDLTWLKSVNPTLAFAVSLVIQAAVSAWFLRGLKADRDRIVADVADAKVAIASHVAATRLAVETLRNDHNDLEQALGIQGSQMLNLSADYDRMTVLVLDTMPKVIQGAVERAEARGESRARRSR